MVDRACRAARGTLRCYLGSVLVAAFALLVLASGVGLWRVVARNQSAMRYLQDPGQGEGESLGRAQLGPEKWAVVAPIRTLELVVRGEIGALNFGNTTALAASTLVNAEVAHWLAQRDRTSVESQDREILDALALRIQSLWDQGRWGCADALDGRVLLDRLEALERSLTNAASQVTAGHSPYR